MGHPLPETLPLTGELSYFLVAIPDNGAMRQAALAAYTKLGSYWVWGKEGPEYPKSNDAANLWNDAVAETLRLWEMGFPDILIGHVDGLETKLDALIACCDPTGSAFQIPSIPPPATVGDITIWPIGNPDTMPPDVADIVSPVGGVSASYPAIPDYDSSGTIGETEFFDYRCAGASFVLDTIINLLRWSAKAKRLVGDVADILSDLAFHLAGHYAAGTPLGNILTVLDMTGAATWPVLLNNTSATALETSANQVEAVKDTIRQELACGASAAGALTILQAALQGTITDAAALAFLTGNGVPGILVSMLWTATLDTGWSAACSCLPSYTYTASWDFEDQTAQYWVPSSGRTIAIDTVSCAPNYGVGVNGGSGEITVTKINMAARGGVTYNSAATYRCRLVTGVNCYSDANSQIRVFYSDLTTDTYALGAVGAFSWEPPNQATKAISSVGLYRSTGMRVDEISFHVDEE